MREGQTDSKRSFARKKVPVPMNNRKSLFEQCINKTRIHLIVDFEKDLRIFKPNFCIQYFVSHALFKLQIFSWAFCEPKPAEKIQKEG